MSKDLKLRNDSNRVLVLYWYPGRLNEMRAAIQQHLYTLEWSTTKHEVLYYNTLRGAPSWLRHCRFDAVILHTTLLCLRWTSFFYNWKWKLRWVGDINSIKIALPQDEYDHSELLDEWLYEWDVSVIFSNFDEPKQKILYPRMHDKAVFYKCFTGYIDESVVTQYQETDYRQRPYDLVYRATHLPYWFGRHGQLKHQIADVVAQHAKARGFTYDISTREEDTILGNDWLKFLASGRAVIGCESGSSVLDRRGEIKAKIQAIQHRRPHITFDEIQKELPTGWDDYEFFALSPRHFEAITTKTCQVLIEGAYDGVLEADKHYIPLKRNFSNLDEVFERVRDEENIKKIAEQAYNDIYLNGKYTFRRFAADIERSLFKQKTNPDWHRSLVNKLMWLLACLGSGLATASANLRYK